MKSQAELKHAALPRVADSRSTIRRKLMSPLVCAVLASFGVLGGVSALFVGIVSVVIHGIVPQEHIFNRVGTVLLIVAIPMILIGSIFLDEIDQRK